MRMMAALAISLAVAVYAQDVPHVFDCSSDSNIISEEHFGIVNGMMTAGVNYSRVGEISGLWAPPYVSSNFSCKVTVGGKSPMPSYVWRPFEVEQCAQVDGFYIRSSISLLYGYRAGIMSFTICPGNRSAAVPVSFTVSGNLDRIAEWQFARPESTTATAAESADGILSLVQGDSSIVCAIQPGHWKLGTGSASSSLQLEFPPNRGLEIDIIFAIGPKDQALQCVKDILADPVAALGAARAEYSRRVDDLFAKLPRFESDNKNLVGLYHRSLVHLLTNQWTVPEFVIHPYYSTGSVKGGCLCNYLWNFGEIWEILPLYDPAAARKHIKQFLRIDLGEHFSFNPMNGEGQGPWYMVNQEKIICLVYYYVLITGDTAFLREALDRRTILDHVIEHATLRDDPKDPGALIDYGPSNSHLELRKNFAYNHVMPDLNGRRYNNYIMAAALADMAGRPQPQLRARAEAIKARLKKQLWDGDAKWFAFEQPDGKRELRYTIQMFKLIGSGVLDSEMEAGLLSHLNEREFLSQFGIHSMSKLDPAYDQVDIDNGGGGACTCFPPQIIERLYKSGHADIADDILTRILWWGARMPYWGDSIVANEMAYRKDTPLQCTVDGATVAQAFIFGMFGISIDANGAITIDPHPPNSAKNVALKNLNIRGRNISIDVGPENYSVNIGADLISQKTGAKLLLQ